MELIQKRAVDILQPDVGHVGGILEAQKIAAMGHARFLPVAPHNPTGPVMNAMTMQLAATIPNFCILETIAVDVPWRKEIVRELLTFTNSEIRIPDVPGLGLELDEAACARHPYVRHPIQQFTEGAAFSRPDGSVPFVTGVIVTSFPGSLPGSLAGPSPRPFSPVASAMVARAASSAGPCRTSGAAPRVSHTSAASGRSRAPKSGNSRIVRPPKSARSPTSRKLSTVSPSARMTA